jgi:hypothetical protein
MQEVADNFNGALDKSIKNQQMATLATAVVGFVLGAINAPEGTGLVSGGLATSCSSAALNPLCGARLRMAAIAVMLGSALWLRYRLLDHCCD